MKPANFLAGFFCFNGICIGIKEHCSANCYIIPFFYYNANVEFYYSVEYPSLEDCFANYGGFVVNSKDNSAKKRIVEGYVQFSPYFYTAGKKFGDKDEEKMLMSVILDDLVFSVFFFDHLEFPKK